MRRHARQHVDAPGQDSFLDVVANLVGILIILVMIIGARAKDVIRSTTTDTPHTTNARADLEQARTALATETQAVRDLNEQVERQQFEVRYRRNERDRILELVKSTEADLARHRSKLSANDQLAHDLRVQLAKAREQLRDLDLTRDTLAETATPKVTLIKHRPTPMAKTVFGQEVHFRLAGGRISYVPLTELVDQFKEEARTKVWKLRQSPTITETVGPIGGFRLRYTLKQVDQPVGVGANVISQQRVELDHFVVVPVAENLGETVDVALQPDSQFFSILSGYDPNRVTVTVWVYPDSYHHFHRLKETLYERGFLTAGRPMPADQPITGSPHGTRSAAQ